ncbi:DEKNAAC104400 [Brettanomyces naardenensis]|uniref:ATP-dependent RNA helicase n=1 Tax=Brettanomyces naardenensis TaxID=13370 RepID=A0A448YQQ4_BRENA|nr:DEKNAAC104400 [Brettanomyces naardenensis]
MSDSDDGMLLNFAVPDASSGASPAKKRKIKMVGGRWRDRRNTKLAMENKGYRGDIREREDRKISGEGGEKERQVATGVTRSPSSHNDEDNDSRKRPRYGPSAGHRALPAGHGSPTGHRTPASGLESRGQNGGKDNSYVSSLFTANPEVKERDYSEKKGVELKPSNAPLLNDESADFSALGVNETLSKSLLEKLEYSKPTRIQRAVIPTLLGEDKDLFVQAQTGSGKTLAFTLPIIQKLMDASDGSMNRKSGIFAIILSPTRELASQTYEFIASKLCSACHWIVPCLIIGGEKKKSEKARIRKGVNILVATPGRLADHIENTDNLDLSNVRYLVLDEGDRLMDLGFQEDITKMLNRLDKDYNPVMTKNLQGSLPKKRVNILCSATMKETVQKLGEISLTDAKLITSQSVDKLESDEMKAPKQLIQEVVVVPPKLRFVTLAGTLKNLTKEKGDEEISKTMVFFSCSDSVDFHFNALTRGGRLLSLEEKRRKPKEVEGKEKQGKEVTNDVSKVTAKTSPLINPDTVIYKLHGSLSQQARTATLSHFSKNTSYKHAILFCTDVASRGLDLPHIKNVVEFDPPFTLEDHLHRVGRTARVGSSGLSMLFLLPGDEENYIKKIEPLHGNEAENLRYLNFEDVLKDAFKEIITEDDQKERNKKRVDRNKKKIPLREGNWDTHATTFQLELERWLLEDARSKEMATNAFISHTRAYTTHLASERDCFNMKKLHLGHLAKSFGLRETPKKLAGQSSKEHGKKKEDNRKKLLRLAREAEKSQSEEFHY